jgi:23S rRNA (guanosine2251-2'-O)-methyltransferase
LQFTSNYYHSSNGVVIQHRCRFSWKYDQECFILAGMPADLFPSPRFQVRQCSRDICRLRFSIEVGNLKAERCPLCGAPARQVEAVYERAVVEREADQVRGPVLEVLLDNIRSAWNVGSMLRSADGAGVRMVHLCGVSSTPDNPKVAKTALSAEKNIPWRFHPDGAAGALALKDQGMRLWALEGGTRAVSLFDTLTELPGPPLVLVVGNELTGVDPGILDLCERVVCLPMQGVKGSLNVAVAFGIAVYTIRFGGPVCGSADQAGKG